MAKLIHEFAKHIKNARNIHLLPPIFPTDSIARSINNCQDLQKYVLGSFLGVKPTEANRSEYSSRWVGVESLATTSPALSTKGLGEPQPLLTKEAGLSKSC